MKRKTSNILICVLAAVVIACGAMAAGTMRGWFVENEQAVEQTVQSETAEENATGAADENTEKTAGDKTEQSAENQKSNQQSNEDKTAQTCTITIKCSNVLKHMDKLEKGKEKYVPSNGIILSTSTIEFREGQSVYDILKRVCSAADITMSARSSSMGVYVEGINGLFEFDCGGTSGWIYSVNSSQPNHSCSEHIVKNGDNIVWDYTCAK